MFVKTRWLDGATFVQTTPALELEGVFRFGAQMSAEGDPVAAVAHLEGSIDGVHWKSLIHNMTPSTETVYQQPTNAVPIRFLRLNLAELSGGSLPRVTITVVGVEVATVLDGNWT